MLPLEGRLLRRVAILALALLLLATAPRPIPSAGTLSPSVVPAPGTPHAPILIDGNAAFTSANGVVSGQGTAAKPYLIENWAINPVNATGIDIRNTTAYFEVLNVGVTNGDGYHDAVHLANVADGTLSGDTLETSRTALVLANVSTVSVTGGTMYQNAADGVDIFGGNRINVSGVSIISNAGSGIIVNGSTNVDLWSNFISSNFGVGTSIAHAAFVRFGLNGIASYSQGLLVSNDTSVAVSGNGLQARDSYVIRGDNVTWLNVTGNTMDPTAGTPIRVSAGSHVAFAGNLVSGSPGPAIDLLASRTVSVTGNTLGSAAAGIRFVSSDGLAASNNNLTAAAQGVLLEASRNATVSGNLFGSAGGATLVATQDTTFTGNTFGSTGILIQGTVLDDFRTHAIASSNTVNGRPVLAYRDCSGLTLDGVAAGQVLLANCSGVALSHLTLNGTSAGIQAAFTSNLALANATISNCTVGGVVLTSVSGVTVQDTVLSHSSLGLSMTGANLTLRRDRLTYDGIGASLRGVVGGLVVGSSFASNSWGMDVKSSRGLLVYANNFTGYGLYAWDDSATANRWDDGYPIGGNFWADYRGWDDCHGILQDNCTAGDGLGDFPYAVSGGGAEDHYPLVPVNPPKMPPVVILQVGTAAPVAGQSVQFFDGSYDPSGWPLASYSWSFGDGNTSSDGSGTVFHAYARPGTYSVSLAVASKRGLTNSTSVVLNVASPPSIALVNWTSSHGYTVPVPAAWSRQYNVTLGNTTYDLELLGTVNGTAADMIVGTFADTKAQETNAYLTAQIQAAMQSLQATYPDAYQGTTTQFTQVSGHLAATFEIDFSAHPIFEDVLLIVSAAHQRDWTVVLAGSTSQHTLLSGAFSRIVSGFVITLAAPTTGGGATNGPPPGIWTFAQILGPVVLIVVVVLVLLTRRRKPEAPPGPSPYVCARCGTPRAMGAKFCGRCGTPFPVEMYLPPPGPPR